VNDDETREVTALFEYSLTQLRVDDEGVAASDYADVVTCAGLCRRMRYVTADAADVHTLLLYRLVCATEALLTTYVVVADDNRLIVNEWFRARGELMSCRLGAL
jgi:hypothetical protein